MNDSAEKFRPALEAAMALARREIDAIACSAAEPTFENTVAALEDAGRVFNRVYEVYDAWSSAMNGPEFQAVELFGLAFGPRRACPSTIRTCASSR